LGSTTLDHGVFRFDPSSEWTGGGLVTSPRDLVRWASALYGGHAIGAQAVAEMVASTPPGSDQETAPSTAPGSGEERRLGYGLGVYLWKGEYGVEYGHGGWFPGYRTSFAFYPDHGVAVAAQTNTDTLSGDGIHQLRRALARVVLSAPESGPAAAPRAGR
jgi:D-alanyl-D-alanine carboxypeptidase